MKHDDKAIASKQCVEVGILLTVGALLLAINSGQTIWVKVSVLMLLVAMIVPILYYPFAFIWFKFVRITGVIGPAIMLTVVFFVVVTPIGWLRRRFGADTLRLRTFKKGRESVLLTRNHPYGPDDFRTMF